LEEKTCNLQSTITYFFYKLQELFFGKRLPWHPVYDVNILVKYLNCDINFFITFYERRIRLMGKMCRSRKRTKLLRCRWKRERRGCHRGEATWFAGPRSRARGGRKVISPRGICVNPAWYDDGGSAAQQPQHPASHLLSSARPTYTGVSAKRCKKDDDDDGNNRTFRVGARPRKNLVKRI